LNFLNSNNFRLLQEKRNRKEKKKETKKNQRKKEKETKEHQIAKSLSLNWAGPHRARGCAAWCKRRPGRSIGFTGKKGIIFPFLPWTREHTLGPDKDRGK
jgi:hypothetical protein